MKTEERTINVAVVENDPLRLVGLQSIFDSIAGIELTALSGNVAPWMASTTFDVAGTDARPRYRKNSGRPLISLGIRKCSVAVQVLQPDLAVACYPFHLSGTRTLADGKHYTGDVPVGRATQVFQYDKAGALLIIHEHFSSSEPVVVKNLTHD